MQMTWLRILAVLGAAIVTFWWILSHWIYSDFYHRVLGFAPGSYDPDFVKVIGTMGVMPLVGFLHTALRPQSSGPFLTAFIVWCFAMAATYAHLILIGSFPAMEWVNASILLLFAVLLIIMHPARVHARRGE